MVLGGPRPVAAAQGGGQTCPQLQENPRKERLLSETPALLHLWLSTPHPRLLPAPLRNLPRTAVESRLPWRWWWVELERLKIRMF